MEPSIVTRTVKRKGKPRKRSLFVLFAMIACYGFVCSPRTKTTASNSVSCGPDILITVLTATRHNSLSRLLISLSSNDFGCSRADLLIHVDYATNTSFEINSRGCVDTASKFHWSHGKKTVHRRIRHAGLSLSWFEIPYMSSEYEYVAIFEDDMEISPSFYSIFSVLHERKSFVSETITAFCLHPDDWEVRVPLTCLDDTYSHLLYESPEPCNWGPIWKYTAWSAYVDWVSEMKTYGDKPYVPASLAYNFNKKLDDGRDVQSSWVWRYNFDRKKRQVRYSFKKCMMHMNEEEVFLAINHKEVGENFATKIDWQAATSLLLFEPQTFLGHLRGENSTIPQPFTEYEYNAKSLTIAEKVLEH